MKPNLSSLALLLLAGLPALVLAHGDEPMKMNMDMNMDMNATAGAASAAGNMDMDDPNYFRHPEHSGLIMAHIVLMTIGWVFVLPLAVVFAIVRSRFSVPTQFTFLVVNVFGVLVGIAYNSNTPDLYPNNAHHKLGWLLTWVVVAQAFIALLDFYAGRSKQQLNFIPISEQALAAHRRYHHIESPAEYRLSHDSGQGTEPNTESLRQNSFSSQSQGEPDDTETGRFLDDESEEIELEKPVQTSRVDRFFARKLAGLVSARVLGFLQLYYHFVNRVILIVGFIALATGAITYGGIFKGHNIFSGLAHFIKGGVFFWYGILTLGRWAGCFADLGWAWNVKPSPAIVGKRKAAAPSAEFVESFLIFFYGSTNVFLEHLGGWGGAWTPQDLEHVSISVLFLGGGLCGMLVESTRIRNLLNATLSRDAAVSLPYTSDVAESESFKEPKSYGFSMNPIPALIIILLGSMMGGHEQASMISSMVHKQWGDLLAMASVMRGVTYVIMYLSPPSSLVPSRPPSELVTAFCLMAGGLIFMASSSDTVAVMEYNGIDAMFVFTVTMGFVAFFMAYVIGVIAIKGWAFRRENKYASAPVLTTA